MRERDTQRVILDWLAAKGILAFRQNTGVLRNPAGRPVRFGVEGMADVLAFPMYRGQCKCGTAHFQVQPVWIECKATDGKQTALQKSFQNLVERHGHRYIVAKSLDEVIEAIG